MTNNHLAEQPKQQEYPLETVEKSVEQNYNQIDRLINNLDTTDILKVKMWKGKYSVRTIDDIGFIPYNNIEDNPYPKKVVLNARF